MITGVEDAERCVALLQRGCPVLRKPFNSAALTDYVRWLLTAGDPVAAFAAAHRLSRRETELLRLIARGTPGKQIPDVMRCSRNTVDTYLRRLLRKTGCASQQEVLAGLLHAVGGARFGRSEASSSVRQELSRNYGT